MDLSDTTSERLVQDAAVAPVKALIAGLTTTWARRRFSIAIEKRSGVRLRYQQFPKLLNTSEAQRHILNRDAKQLGHLIQPALDARAPTRDDLERVAVNAIEFVHETAAPELAALFSTHDNTLELKQLTQDWAPPAAHHGPDDYLSQLRTEDVLGRDNDLDNLAYLMRWATRGYVAVSAKPFAGKTTVMCEVAAAPPPNVDVISFFIRKDVSRNRAADFLESTNRQLIALTGERIGPGEGISSARANFERLWSVAAIQAKRTGRTLVLLVDGLDGQATDEQLAISQLLPSKLGPHEVVLVATRPDPPVIPGVDSAHGLSEALKIPYELGPSEHATRPRGTTNSGGVPSNAYHSAFLSYSHADREPVRAIYDQLVARGVPCWLDEHQLLAGDRLASHIDEAIRGADKLVVFCSESSLSPGMNYWVGREVGRALDEEHERSRRNQQETAILVPVALDGYLFSDECTYALKRDLTSRTVATHLDTESTVGRLISALATSDERPFQNFFDPTRHSSA